MDKLLPILAVMGQETTGDAEGALLAVLLSGGIFAFVFGLTCLMTVPMLAGMWKVFEKAGQPGWAALVPIYNIVVLLEIVNRPLWWLALMVIPCANVVAAVIVQIDVAKAFGKDALYGVGLAVLGVVLWPMLGFGDARYTRPVRPL